MKTTMTYEYHHQQTQLHVNKYKIFSLYGLFVVLALRQFCAVPAFIALQSKTKNFITNETEYKSKCTKHLTHDFYVIWSRGILPINHSFIHKSQRIWQVLKSVPTWQPPRPTLFKLIIHPTRLYIFIGGHHRLQLVIDDLFAILVLI